MVSTFVVLAIVLLDLPVSAGIFVSIANINRSKRAKVMANAATTRTTMTQGPNGRTVFEATATRHAPPRPQRPSHDPVLPYNIQQAYKAPSARKPSLKHAWQRLSRPFSMGPRQYDDDQIELTQKQPPLPYNSNIQQQTKSSYEGPVSPITTQDAPRNRFSSSWNAFDPLNHNSDPISPLSATNMTATSSVTGTILHGYQNQRQPPTAISHIAIPQNTIDTIPHTPPTRKQSRPMGLGSARGFIPSPVDITNKRQIKDFAKHKGREVTKQAVTAGTSCATEKIKTKIVDANKTKINRVQLAKPPKAKTKNGKPPTGFI